MRRLLAALRRWYDGQQPVYYSRTPEGLGVPLPPLEEQPK